MCTYVWGWHHYTRIGPYGALQPLQLCFPSLRHLFTYQLPARSWLWCKKGQWVRMGMAHEAQARDGAEILPWGRGRDADSGSLAAEQHQCWGCPQCGMAQGSCPCASKLCCGCSSSMSTSCCHGPWRLCWPWARMMSYADDPASTLLRSVSPSSPGCECAPECIRRNISYRSV